MASIPPACSEHELITAARDGSDRAFEELYSRYRVRIGAFILGRVHDHGRAEDIAQEVFISALRRLRASEQAIAFKPWIYEIAKNACIDEFRRSRRTREVSLDADQGLAGGHRALHSILPTPPAAAESKQCIDDLRGAFGGLSENHHQLLVMREFEGLSYDEIGARTGMSRQMVESALFRARRKLTEEYDELASGRRCQQIQGAIEDGRAVTLRSFGIRERRQLTRHLAHCQPCRVKAHLAGVDEALVRPRSVGAKIAALLPFPLWRWPWRGGPAARNALARTGSNHVTVQAVQGAAAAAEPAATATTFGGAAIAAVAIATAGAGGAAVSGVSSRGHPARATRSALLLRSRATGSGSVSARRAHALSHLGSVSGVRTDPVILRLPVKRRPGGTAEPAAGAPRPTGKPSALVSTPALPTVAGTRTAAATTVSGSSKSTFATVHQVLAPATHGRPLPGGASTLSSTLNGVRSVVGSGGSATPGTTVTAAPATPASTPVSSLTSTVTTTPTKPASTVSTTASGLLPK